MSNKELIEAAREQIGWIEDGSGDFDSWERLARMAGPLADALEAAESPTTDEPRYTMREAGLLIADKLEEQGIYSGAGYLRDNLTVVQP
jgi:hypothetical protein